MRLRRRISIGAAAAAAALLVGLLVAPEPASATGVTTVAPGVTVWHTTFASSGHKTVRGVLMRIDLRTPGLSLNAASPHELVGTNRATVASQADGSGAVAGINGDFFDMSQTASVFRGVLIRHGVLRKTPRPSWQANFYVDGNGRAQIGELPFTGTVTAAGGAAYRIYSVNTPSDAAAGRITLVDSDLINPLQLPAGCTTVLGTGSGTQRTVSAVLTGLGWLPRLGTAWWALVGCGAAGSWLTGNTHTGDSLGITLAFPNGEPRTALSGGRVLVRQGIAYDDPDRPPVDQSTRNPETFACLSSSGLFVTLGALDGRSKASAGVTYAELTNYLLQLHCYGGIVFDGGGSTTMVARLPGHHTNSVLNVPSDGTPRAVADGLFVYSG